MPGARSAAARPLRPVVAQDRRKTVTKLLTDEQVIRYQAWFDDARRLRELVTELEALSLHALEEAERWGDK